MFSTSQMSWVKTWDTTQKCKQKDRTSCFDTVIHACSCYQHDRILCFAPSPTSPRNISRTCTAVTAVSPQAVIKPRGSTGFGPTATAWPGWSSQEPVHRGSPVAGCCWDDPKMRLWLYWAPRVALPLMEAQALSCVGFRWICISFVACLHFHGPLKFHNFCKLMIPRHGFSWR
jgi:hypothetical protein